jgi:hypothetical protein
MSRSIIYRHLWLYRAVMSLLYKGRYQQRFQRVCALIRASDETVLELCFGDVAVAKYCQQRGKGWTGIDESAQFVAHAVSRGFDARKDDVLRMRAFPACDVCVMMGSLYHFKARLPDLFRRVKAASSRFILSEPVRNWTQTAGLLKRLAAALTRTDRQSQTFRFTEASLTQALNELRKEVGFNYRVVSVARDMIVEVVWSS